MGVDSMLSELVENLQETKQHHAHNTSVEGELDVI